MTIDEKRIKVAEKCGWKQLDAWAHSTQWAGRWETGNPNPVETAVSIPDYPNDLNSMHEAEKVLSIKLPIVPHTESEKTRYFNRLVEKCGGYGCAFADAATRFEAFGLTLGLWKEGE